MISRLLFALAAISSICEATLPANITPCSRNLADPATCLLDAIRIIQPKLVHGDLGNGFRVPSLEPFRLKSMNMNRGPELQAKFSNISVHGASDFSITNMVADVQRMRFKYTMLLPRVRATGQYQLGMKLLVLQLHGKGDLDALYKNIRSDVQVQCSKQQRNGIDYLHVDHLDAHLEIGSAHFKMTNLFGDNPAVSDLGNQFVNDNSELFIAEMKPGFEHSMAKTFRQIVNEVLHDVPFDELFPDS